MSLAVRTTDFLLEWNRTNPLLRFTDPQASCTLAIKGGFCYNSKIAIPLLNLGYFYTSGERWAHESTSL